MKNYLLPLVVLVLLSACQEAALNSSTAKVQLTNDEIARLPLLDTDFTCSTKKATDMALDFASKFLDGKDGIKRTVSNIVTVPSLYSITGKTNIKTDFTISKPQTPSIYIANFNEGKGFVMLSADKRAPKILAIVVSGTIDSTSNIGLRIFIENSVKHMDELVAKAESYRNDAIFKSLVSKLKLDTEPSKPNARVAYYACNKTVTTEPYNTIGSTSYITTPLLQTLWDQGHPYNSAMPDGGCYHRTNCATNTAYWAGCGPVAEGQVVAYFRAKRNMGDWPAITALQTGCHFNATQANAVANMLHSIYLDYGIYVKRNCDETAVGFQVSDISVVGPRGISPDFDLVHGEWRSWNTGDIRNSLSQGSPVVICGMQNLCCVIFCAGCGKGHEWVIDGMRDLNVTTTYQVTTSSTGGNSACPPPTVTYYSTTALVSTQIHQNWGWGPNTGSDANDWYAQDVFQSNTNPTTGDNNFDHANYIVAYITPF